ncbi:hypothetical protein HK096_008705, partial [Nowakowskiella sp. JEL0078]
NYVSNPFYFAYATLVSANNSEEINVLKDTNSRAMTGSIASSLQRLKDIDGAYGGFFVFPDISIRLEGKFRLRFTLFEIVENEVIRRNYVNSDVFTVYSPKFFPGMAESTSLSKFFAEQGLKIRLRKEPRTGKAKNYKNYDEGDSEEEETERKRPRSAEDVEESTRVLPSISRAQIAEEESGRMTFNHNNNRSPQWNQGRITSPSTIYPQQYGSQPPQNRPNFPDHLDSRLGRMPPTQGMDPRYSYPYPQPPCGTPHPNHLNQHPHHGYPHPSHQQYGPGFGPTQYSYPPAVPRNDRGYSNYPCYPNDYGRTSSASPRNSENSMPVSHAREPLLHPRLGADSVSSEANFLTATAPPNLGYHNYQSNYHLSGPIGERGMAMGQNSAQTGYYPTYPDQSGSIFGPRNGTTSGHPNHPHAPPPAPYYQGPPTGPSQAHYNQRSPYRSDHNGSNFNSSAF